MKYKNVFIVAVFVSSLIFGSFIGTVEAADTDLAQQYAPIFYFEKDESCFPVDVSYHIDNSNLYVVGDDSAINFTEENLSDYSTDGFYLDNQKGSIDDNGIINDYTSSNLGYTIYSHVNSSGGTTIIQYWMFYAFNPGTMNQHEGDWEMVQVILSGGTPTQVMYSQHHSGQKATWDQVERNGDHIKVYVSRGSHANYLRSFSGVVGVANDIVGANGRILNPEDYDLEMLESQPWLDFAGRWGWYGSTEEEAAEASLLGQAGPNGPKFREDPAMWDYPLDWGNNLIQADNNVFILEMVLYNFVTLFIAITVILLCVLLFRIYRRHKKTGLGPRIISIFYIDGLNAKSIGNILCIIGIIVAIKSIGNILCIIGIIVAIFSLITPWYVISTDIRVSGYETHGMADMMTVDGINGIQIQVPGLTGPMPMGSIMIPFSLLIAISLVFLIIASIGVSHSKKLGRKYLARGAKLMVPVFLIIIIIMSLGMIPFESLAGTGDADVNIGEIIGAISASPSGGQKIVSIADVNGQIEFHWGFGIGAISLIVSGLILVIAGALEIIANTEFFAGKTIEKSNKEKPKKSKKRSKESKEESSEGGNAEEPKPEDFEENKKE